MREVILYGALLSAAMVGSYLTWTADDATRTDDARTVAVYRAEAGDVSKIFYDSDKLKVVVERRNDAKGSYPWITIDETKETTILPTHDHDEDPHEEGPQATDAPEPEPEVKIEQLHKEFRGNDNADGLLSAFEPLTALRELDAAATSNEIFGFDEPSAILHITRSSGEVQLVLGGETYGSRDRYAQYDNRVLLLASTAIKPLQFAASRTIERRLQPWPEQDVSKLMLKSPKGELELTQLHKEDRKAAFWTRDGSTADDLASTWAEKAFRTRADQHADETDLTGLTPALSLIFDKGGETFTIEWFTGSEGDEVYARSDYLRGIAKLKKADAVELLEEADELFQE